ncbi:MAG: RNA helicase [Ignavibacteria bacterium]|nr:MAG: RNA helicase [Ignavibacteria bacterium]
MQFEDLGLSSAVLRAVSAAGYKTPTEIQALAIPPAISGGDVIGRAKTGSGKTAAFVLPILDRLEGGRRPSRGAVRALVLTPTRELAQQVADAARKYSRYLKLSSDAFYGGVSIEPQLKRMRRGVDILAATPGRLLDHMERGSIDLSRCEVLIVDEADRMFDMGFIKDVRRIIKAVSKQRQTMLFSATMSKDVQRLTADIMNDPKLVEVGIEGNPAESVRQQFISVPKHGKLDLLFHLINENKMESVLVFSRTKHGADKIAKRLMRSGIGTGVLHSNRSQSQRLRALSGFRNGEQRVLVATDIAARGIDVVGISHVINFDTPTFAEDYVHRIGRTGRADATGDAITFVSSEEKAYLRRIESFVGKRYFVEAGPAVSAAPMTDAPVEKSFKDSGSPKRNGRNDKRSAPKSKQRYDSAGGDQPRDRKHRTDKAKRKTAHGEATGSDRPWKKNGKRNGKPRTEDAKFEHRGSNNRSEGPSKRDDDRTFNTEGRNQARHSGATPFGGPADRYGKKKRAVHSGQANGSKSNWKRNGSGEEIPTKVKRKSRDWDFTDRKRDPRFAAK